jgi:fructose/tagatose bisphosphate aldolase
MIFKDADELFSSGGIKEENERFLITDFELFRRRTVDDLVDTLILSNSRQLKRLCQWAAYEAALKFGVIPASIHGLYEARGRGQVPGNFTVPAMNIRTLTYEIARAAFRSAAKTNAATFIFEIARSEIGYTNQRPIEYVSVILLAAIKEGYRGPLFLQGDHFRISAPDYQRGRQVELDKLNKLVKESVDVGIYNVDIDASALIDLSKSDPAQQQQYNYEISADLTKFLRNIQPPGIEISIGAEIGELSGRNTTSSEVRAFMQGYLDRSVGVKGLSKLSIQAGTTHGGVVLPDGTIARVKIDFDTLRDISRLILEDYKLAGCVQHGASTLPNEAFHMFPSCSCIEVHLATQFQNMAYDYFPISLKEQIYNWLRTNCALERLPDQTDDQFIYKTRKKALGPFKKQIYSLPRDLRLKISQAMEAEFDFLFAQLNIANTRSLVQEHIKTVPIFKSKLEFLSEESDLGALESGD